MSATVPGTRSEPLAVTFRRLTDRWKEETRFLSSTTAIANHPAYQEIIQMGPPVVPLILDELRREPGWWFAALRAITGENPVPHEDRGRLTRMTEAWLRWAADRGIASAS